MQNSAHGHKAASGPLSLAQGRIAVAIVDNDERSHLLIQAILAQTQDFHWGSSYSSSEAALVGIPQSGLQVVLMDVKMPGMSGIECTKRLKSLMPDLKIVMMSRLADSDSIDQSLQAGAVDYLIKPVSLAQCLATLKSAVYRRTGLEQKPLDQEQTSRPAAGSEPCSLLTARENEVMKCLAQGFRYKEIPEELHLSHALVKKLQHSAFVKLGASSCIEALNRWQTLR